MKNKIVNDYLISACISVVFVFLFLSSLQSKAQGFQQDQVIRIGYRLGFESFNGAYRTFTPITNSTGGILGYKFDKEYNDHLYLSNYEIWYGRFSEFAFYEAKIDGMITLLEDMFRRDANGLNCFWLFEKFKNGKDNGLKEIKAIDYDLLNFKLAFGAKGLYLGGQWKITRLGYFSGASNSNTINGKELVGFGYSEDNYTSLGLGVHANVSFKNFIAQNHLMLNWVKSKSGYFKGKELEFESLVNIGKELGVYVAPFIYKRFGSKDKTYPVMYGTSDTGKYMGLNGTFTIGLKLGFYIASEEKKGNVYIHL